MKIKHNLSLVSLLILFSGCATTKLIDSWKSNKFTTLSNSRIVVISQSPEASIRKSYEIAITDKLRVQGVDAVASHLKFPTLTEAKTPEEIEKTIQMFKTANINGIILTSLKQTIETKNGQLSSPNVIPAAYADKSSFGANANDNNVFPVSTSKTYILEALIYNLELEDDDQLVNVCLVDVTDPNSVAKIQKTFTKIIADQFK